MASIVLDVRKLAALDMALHGRRFIVVEFGAGVVGCGLLGALSIGGWLKAGGHGGWQLALGVILLWIGLNYVPLLIHAIDLARKGSAREEAKNELDRAALTRRYGLLQLWILVPFAVIVMDLLPRARR